MASTLIGALRVKFSADSAAFEAGAKRVRQQASLTARAMGSAKSAAGGFFAAFSVGLLATVIKRSLDYAGSLAEIGQQLGVTTRDLQVFRFAAGQVGVSQEGLEVGLSKLTITMGKVAAGAAAPTKAFNAIGISVDELKGKDTGEVFRMIADGLAKIPDRAQRAAVEVALFGKSGAQLDNMLAGGRGAIDALASAADRLGIVLSDEQIQKADETADKLEAVKTVLAAQIAGVVADNATSILSLASALGTLTGEIVRFLNSNPQLALGIIGALLGGRLGGLPGAVLGGAAGAILGGRMKTGMDNNNTDLQFRIQQVRNAKDRLKAARLAPGSAVDDSGVKAPINNSTAIGAARAELDRQVDLLRSATAGATRPKVPAAAGGTVLPQFLADGGGGGKKPKDESKELERKRLDALRDAYRFDQDQRRNQMDILSAQRDLAVNADDRTAIALQLLDLDRQGQQAELAYQVATGDLTQAQANKLDAQNAQLDALKRQAIAEEAAAQKKEDNERLIEVDFDIQRQALEAQAGLAKSSAERRDIELQLLELAYQEKRQALQRVVSNDKLDAAVRQRAAAELAALPNQHGLDQAGVVQSTAGPWEQWLSSASNVTDQMQNLKVMGINGAIDALGALTGGFDDFRDAAVGAIKAVIAEFIRLQLMKAAFSLFGNAVGAGIGGGGAGAGIALGGGTSSFFASNPIGGAIPHFAGGGSMQIFGKRGTDRNTLSLNGTPIARVSHGEQLSIANDNGGGRRGGDVHVHAPVTVLGDVRQPRRTGLQIGGGIKSEVAKATKRGN